MKISIITIVYNDVDHIADTIENIIGQTAFCSIEYIVVDGASTDGTSDIIKRYLDKIDSYICEKDSGIYNAMNKGLKNATGDYAVFINCGDRLSDEHVIEHVIKAIGNKIPDVVYGDYREVKSYGKPSRVIPCRESKKIWYGPVTSHQSTFYRIQHLREHNLLYDESFRIAADYKLTAQAISLADSILKTDICISDFDVSGVSNTNQNLGLREANRVRREVFHWSPLRISALTCVLLSTRYLKKYCYPLYTLLRHR